MKNKIKFQNFDEEFFEEEYEYSFDEKDEIITAAQTHGKTLYYLYKDAVKWITLKIVNGETGREELRDYFKLAMQGIYGHILTRDANGEAVKVPVGDKEVELVNEGNSYSHVFELMDAFNDATICRCNPLLDLVFSKSQSSRFLNNGEHSYHPVYQQYFLFKNEHSVTKEQFEEYLKCSEEYEKQDTGSENYYSLIDYPRRKLLKEYFFGTEASFNKQLAESLKGNKEYYDTTEDNRLRNVDGWLPWEIISNACLAYDKGWGITVEDPRLPMFLVKGECKVEGLAP